RINRVFGIGNRLPLGHLADQPLSVFRKSDNRRSGSAAFFVGDDLGLATLHNRNARVRGAEVNSDNLGHNALLNFKPISAFLSAVSHERRATSKPAFACSKAHCSSLTAE